MKLKIILGLMLVGAIGYGAANKIPNGDLANMAQSTIKGRAAAAGTGAVTDLSATQATAILNALVGDSGAGGTKGLAPAPSAGDAAALKFLKADGTWATISGSDHGALAGLSDDDHTQYALLAGRSGGQILTGGTSAGESLSLLSTSNGTKGNVFLGTLSAYDQVNDRLGIGNTAPGYKLDLAATAANETVLSLDPQTGTDIDFRFETNTFRIDKGVGSLLVFDSGFLNLGGTRTPKWQVELQATSTSTDVGTGVVFNNGNVPNFAIVNSNTTANNWSALAFTGSSTAATAADSIIAGVHESHTGSSESGHLEFWTRNAGTIAKKMDIAKDGTLTLPTYTTIGALVNGSTGVISSVAPGTSGNVLTSDGTDWTSAAPSAGAQDSSYELTNLGIAASVGGSAMTIALKQKDGSTDPAAGGGAVKIAFRDATAATGAYSQVSVTGSLSTVISSGSTAGATSAMANWIYVYAINNAGTVELAWSGSKFVDDGSVVTTTAEGGAGAADSKSVIYSTTARTGVAVRLIGRVKSTQATAGTWATSPSEISVWPFERAAPRSEVFVDTGTANGSTNTSVQRYTNIRKNIGSDITYADSVANGGSFTINTDGLYSITAVGANTGTTGYSVITVNGTALTGGVSSQTYAAGGRCGNADVGADANRSAVCSWTGILAAGDVVRVQNNGTTCSGDFRCLVSIVKVSN